MVEVHGEDGVVAAGPDGGGDGKVEDDEAFDGLAGVDAGFAEEERGGLGGGQFSEGGEAGVEIGEVSSFDSAGGGLEGAVRGNEGSGEVLEEKGEAEAVGDADGDEGVEVVLHLVAADDIGLGFEDRVRGEEVNAGDGDIGGGVRSEADEEEGGKRKDGEREQDWDGDVSALGLREVEIGHEMRIAAGRMGRVLLPMGTALWEMKRN